LQDSNGYHKQQARAPRQHENTRRLGIFEHFQKLPPDLRLFVSICGFRFSDFSSPIPSHPAG
jgi:hypothetical protein